MQNHINFIEGSAVFDQAPCSEEESGRDARKIPACDGSANHHIAHQVHGTVKVSNSRTKGSMPYLWWLLKEVLVPGQLQLGSISSPLENPARKQWTAD